METVLKWESRHLDSRFSHVKFWRSLPGFKCFYLTNEWVNYRSSKFLLADILGRVLMEFFLKLAVTDVMGHIQVSHSPWKVWISVWLYRIRQPIKEENFLLTLVLKRTPPAGQIRAGLSSGKQRDQLQTMFFFSCALKFLSLSSLRSIPIY